MPCCIACFLTRVLSEYEAQHGLPYRSVNTRVKVVVFGEPENALVIEQRVSRIREELHPRNLQFVVLPVWVSDWFELLLMSCCDCHVIAASSFSWWGAYMHELSNRRWEAWAPEKALLVAYPRPPALSRAKLLKGEQFLRHWMEVTYSGEFAHSELNTARQADMDVTSVTIAYPAEGTVVSLPVSPLIQVNVGHDVAGNDIRSDIYNWDVCMELGQRLPQCFSIAKNLEIPLLADLDPGATCTLRAYYFRHEDDRGPERRVAVTTSTFTIAQ